MKALFFGSDVLAVASLEALEASSGHEVVAVVGMPDRAAGRGLTRSKTPVVERSLEMGIGVMQPPGLSEAHFAHELPEPGSDIGVVVAYGGMIPGWLLRAPPSGFVNIHPSLLPRYRGAAPVERAVMQGATITGVTSIQMTEELDAGGILLHREEPVYEEDTAGTLKGRLAGIGARLLVDTLDGLENGSLSPVPQEEAKSSWAPRIRPQECEIDWSQPAERIHRLVRALNPDYGAYTGFRGRRLKIWATRVTDVPREDEPGILMNLGKEGFLVNTGTTCLQVVTLQAEGRQRMSAAEFSRGQRLLIGERFERGSS